MNNKPKGIVVGVDGSAAGFAAAQWALAEAQRNHAPLTLVHAWNFDVATPYGPFESLDVAAAQVELRHSLSHEMTRLREQATDPGLVIECMVVNGEPGPVLVDSARQAELLVVGSRGRGPLARPVMGSVASYCVHHARCPTVVVPFRGDEAVESEDGTETAGQPVG